MTHPTLLAYARRLAEPVANVQYGGAMVSVRGRIAYLEEVQADGAGSRKPSLEHLEPIAGHTVQSGRATSAIGLRVRHMVACPCVQNTYRHATRLRQRTYGAMSDDAMPLMTHSQRCVTTLIVQGVREPRSFAEMLGQRG